MNKKKTIVVKLMVSFVLALVLCLGTAAPAFASDDFSTGRNGNDAEAAITKILTIPAGMVTPVKDYVFTFEAKTVNGEDATSYNMPDISNRTIQIKTDSPSTIDAGGNKVVTVQSGNIFAGVVWPHAGEYVYEVREDGGSDPGYTYSQAMYEFHIFVENKNGKLEVVAISAYKKINDDGSPDNSGEKTNPTPDGGSPGSTVSDVKYNNSYTGTIGGTDPEEPGAHVLRIGKMVVGGYADETKYFSFELTMNVPNAGAGSTYRAFVVEKDGDNKYKVVTGEKNYEGSLGSGSSIPVSATGTTCTFYLKHGQELVFIDLPLGTKCTVAENVDARYSPKAVKHIVNENGVPDNGSVGVNDIQGNKLTVGPFFISEAVSPAPSTVNYTNTFGVISPTGVSVDNLPFVMLIVFALVALTGYVVFRTRRTAAKAGK